MRAQPLIGLIALVVSPLVIASGLGSDAITGVWQTKSNGYVEIYKQDNHFVGIAVGDTKGKPRYDTHNPDPSKRGRRLLGVKLIRHLAYDSGNSYHNGQIYDPDNGKIYSLNAKLINQNTLRLHGYVGISWFGKTQIWHRINPQRPNVHQDQLHSPLPSKPGAG